MSILQNTKFSVKKQPSDFFDWATFFISLLLVTAGLISIYSATADSGMSSFFYKQVMYVCISYGLMFLIMFLPERWIVFNSYIVYGVSILLLIAVLIFGREIYGTKGWMDIAGFSIQPSEFAKFSCLLLMGTFLSRKGVDIKTLRDLGILFSIIGLPLLLIVVEPDIGSASVLIAMTLGVMLWSGFDIYILFFVVSLPIVIILSFMGTVYFVIAVSLFSIIAALFRKKVLVTVVTIATVFAIGYLSPIIIEHLAPHQQGRIETFLNPGSDPRGKGYNVIQSILAVGSGGVTGKGFMQGTQTQLRYIPKQWTDFIFCVPTEEFGFIGGLTVIILLSAMIMRCVTIAFEADSKFFSVVAIGTGTVFLYHSFINIGMAIGLMPVMGIPLPFLSAGGSSLMVNLSFVGLLMNAYRSKLKRDTNN